MNNGEGKSILKKPTTLLSLISFSAHDSKKIPSKGSVLIKSEEWESLGVEIKDNSEINDHSSLSKGSKEKQPTLMSKAKTFFNGAFQKNSPQ